MLHLIFEKLKQATDKPTSSYISEAVSLCRRIDFNISQEEMFKNCMKDLK